MKKTIMTLVTLTSASVIASENLPKQCKNEKIRSSYIEHKAVRGRQVNIVHLFGEPARALYLKIDSDETVVTEYDVDYVIKTQKNTEISCLREEQIQQNGCTNYQCVI